MCVYMYIYIYIYIYDTPQSHQTSSHGAALEEQVQPMFAS